MGDSKTRLASQFERAGLAVVMAFLLAVSALIWLYWPDRTIRAFSSDPSTTGTGSIALIGDNENSIGDRLRRLERIPHPELTLLILIGVALACAVPLISHASTVSTLGRFTCRLGQLFGALFAVAGFAAGVDVLYQQHSLDALEQPLNHLNAAALAAVSVVLARFGTTSTETEPTRGRITRVKRPVPRPLGVPRNPRGDR